MMYTTLKSLIKQNSLDDPFDNGMDKDEDLMKEIDNMRHGSDDDLPPTPPRPSTPTVSQQKTLPWKPKVRFVLVQNLFFTLEIYMYCVL